MAEGGIEAVRAKIEALPPSHGQPVEALRALYDKAVRAFPVGDDVAVEAAVVGGVPSERVTPAGVATDACLLYLHGGGYAIGSPRSHRHLAAAIARHAGIAAVVPDYRLAPENAYPAAVDDALAVYRAVLDGGIKPSRVAIAGDSAGGGLTVAVMLAARAAGLPMPAAGICISPWTDMTAAGASHRDKAAVDPLVKGPDLARWRDAYLAGADRRTPLASPLHADLTGLPPLLIQVGEDEVLLDDSRALAARAKAAAVDVRLEEWPRMIHVWHWYWPMLEDGVRAIAGIGAFARQRLGA